MGQARVFHGELLVLFRQGMEGGSTAPLLGRQPLEFTLLPLTASGGQVGGIQAFPAEQRTDAALVTAALGLVEDRPFVCPAALGMRSCGPPPARRA